MLYTIAQFLAEHPIILAGIGSALAILGAAMPYAAGRLRPPEYVYLAWATIKIDTPTFEFTPMFSGDDWRYQWPHRKDSIILPVHSPLAKLTGTSFLVLLSPTHWDSEVQMTLLEETTPRQAVTHLSLPLLGSVKLTGDGTVAFKPREGTEGVYNAQFIEWGGRIRLDESSRVQITRSTKGDSMSRDGG